MLMRIPRDSNKFKSTNAGDDAMYMMSEEFLKPVNGSES